MLTNCVVIGCATVGNKGFYRVTLTMAIKSLFVLNCFIRIFGKYPLSYNIFIYLMHIHKDVCPYTQVPHYDGLWLCFVSQKSSLSRFSILFVAVSLHITKTVLLWWSQMWLLKAVTMNMVIKTSKILL
jgi:hypothetical protein